MYTVKTFIPRSVSTAQPYRRNIMNSYAVKSIKNPKESKTQKVINPPKRKGVFLPRHISLLFVSPSNQLSNK